MRTGAPEPLADGDIGALGESRTRDWPFRRRLPRSARTSARRAERGSNPQERFCRSNASQRIGSRSSRRESNSQHPSWQDGAGTNRATAVERAAGIEPAWYALEGRPVAKTMLANRAAAPLVVGGEPKRWRSNAEPPTGIEPVDPPYRGGAFPEKAALVETERIELSLLVCKTSTRPSCCVPVRRASAESHRVLDFWRIVGPCDL